MKALSGKEFARLLESHGWSQQRTNGSHHIYAKLGSPVRNSRQRFAQDRSATSPDEVGRFAALARVRADWFGRGFSSRRLHHYFADTVQGSLSFFVRAMSVTKRLGSMSLNLGFSFCAT